MNILGKHEDESDSYTPPTQAEEDREELCLILGLPHTTAMSHVIRAIRDRGHRLAELEGQWLASQEDKP